MQPLNKPLISSNNFLNDNDLDKKCPTLVLFGWLLLLAGWGISLVYSNGFELQRLALTFPLLATGAVLCMWRQAIDVRLIGGILIIGGYFLVRAHYSEVFEIARRDVLLISSSALGILSAAVTFRFRICRGLFLFGILAGLLVQGWGSAIQYFDDMSWSFLRERRPLNKISGTFYSRNGLAGFLELAVPLFLILALERKRLCWLWMIPVLLGVGLCFLTEGRGGFLAMLAAIGIILAVKFAGVLRSKESSPKKKLIQILLLLVFLVAGVAVLGNLFIRLQDARGGGTSSIGHLQDRFAMAGIAFAIWEKNPIFGAGADSFSYLYVSEFGGLPSWYGNAVMAHNEFLQVLADYGLVGLILLGSLIFMALFLFTRHFYLSFFQYRWPILAAVAAIIAELLRGVVDFNLHLLPNLLLFSFLLGGGFSFALSNQNFEKNRRRSLVFGNITALIFVFVSLFSIRAELAASAQFVRLEFEEAKMGFVSQKSLRAYTLSAPEFKTSRQLARLSMADALNEPDKTELMEIATKDWARVVRLHPRDGESLSNYARMLDEGQKFEKAELFHLEAIRGAARRELNYGVLYNYGNHLIRRGSAALGARKPEVALAYYIEAQDVLLQSYNLQYRRDLNRIISAQLENRIDFLKQARISKGELDLKDWRTLVD